MEILIDGLCLGAFFSHPSPLCPSCHQEVSEVLGIPEATQLGPQGTVQDRMSSRDGDFPRKYSRSKRMDDLVDGPDDRMPAPFMVEVPWTTSNGRGETAGKAGQENPIQKVVVVLRDAYFHSMLCFPLLVPKGAPRFQ